MSMPPDLLTQYLKQFSMGSAPGAGINIPQFEQSYAAPPPPAPPVVTQGDPLGMALATVGANLAQPIAPGQSAMGNTATAALSGLQYLNQERQAQNLANQVDFKNEMDRTGTRRDQGQMVVNAHQANAQREYYSGLLRNAGLGEILDAGGKDSDRIMEWAKIAESLSGKILESAANIWDPEQLQQMYPTGTMGIFQDLMDKFLPNETRDIMLARRKQEALRNQQIADQAEKDSRWTALITKYPFLEALGRDEFEKNPKAFQKKAADAIAEYERQKIISDTESSTAGDALYNLINPSPITGGGQSPTTPTETVRTGQGRTTVITNTGDTTKTLIDHLKEVEDQNTSYRNPRAQ